MLGEIVAYLTIGTSGSYLYWGTKKSLDLKYFISRQASLFHLVTLSFFLSLTLSLYFSLYISLSLSFTLFISPSFSLFPELKPGILMANFIFFSSFGKAQNHGVSWMQTVMWYFLKICESDCYTVQKSLHTVISLPTDSPPTGVCHFMHVQ